MPCTTGVDKGESLLWSQKCFAELQVPDMLSVKPPTLRDVRKTVQRMTQRTAAMPQLGQDVEL